MAPGNSLLAANPCLEPCSSECQHYILQAVQWQGYRSVAGKKTVHAGCHFSVMSSQFAFSCKTTHTVIQYAIRNESDQSEILRLFCFNKCSSCARIIGSNVSIIRFILNPRKMLKTEINHKSDDM